MSGMISRRSFFRWLPLVAAGAATGARGIEKHTTSTFRAYHLETFYIAGYQFHDGASCENELDAGASLGVVHEPENPHDEKAVRLTWRGAHIGYVPRRLNRILAHLLAQEAPLNARIVKINRDEPTWHRIKVEIAIPTQEETAA